MSADPCEHSKVSDGGTRLICDACGWSGYLNERALLSKENGPLFFWLPGLRPPPQPTVILTSGAKPERSRRSRRSASS